MQPCQNSCCTCQDTNVSILSSLNTDIILSSDSGTCPFLIATHLRLSYMQNGHHRSLSFVKLCGVQCLKCCVTLQPKHLWYNFTPSMLLQTCTCSAPGCCNSAVVLLVKTSPGFSTWVSNSDATLQSSSSSCSVSPTLLLLLPTCFLPC